MLAAVQLPDLCSLFLMPPLQEDDSEEHILFPRVGMKGQFDSAIDTFGTSQCLIIAVQEDEGDGNADLTPNWQRAWQRRQPWLTLSRRAANQPVLITALQETRAMTMQSCLPPRRAASVQAATAQPLKMCSKPASISSLLCRRTRAMTMQT